MATATQRLLWTALPNGWNDERSRLRLSVMLSPRLVLSPGPDGELAAFPDILNLPSLVRNARFEVEFAGTTAPADRTSEPDDAVHAKLFPPSTAVLSRAVEDRRSTDVLSFPVAAVEADLTRIYGQLAGEADGELPLLDDLRQRFAPLGRAVSGRSPLDLLDGLRERRDQVDPEAVDVRLNLVDLYNTPLSTREKRTYRKQGPDDPREDVSWETYALAPLPAPDSFRRTFDVHAVVSALAQYPLLLRLTGLVVDLEVDREAFPPGAHTGPLAVLVTWTSVPETADAGVTLLPDLRPQTQTVLDGGTFAAVPAAPLGVAEQEGFVTLSRNEISVSQVDVNGSALKLRQFAVTMFQHPGSTGAKPPADPVAVQPDRTGTPALRSGGLTVAMARRAAALEERFDRSGSMDDADAAGAPVLLYAEDLLRGYRVEAFDSALSQWRSLCRRDSRYTFVADASTLDDEDNEGIVRLAASAAADGSRPNLLALYEGLFTWSGWSLAAPPIGRAVTADDAIGDSTGVAPVGLPLDVDHRVRARSLPVLRFGRRYSFRLRTVDLAGNALAFDAERESPDSSETDPTEYLRFEPLPAPSLALVSDSPGSGFPGPGEDLATVAIRSLNATPEDDAVSSSEVGVRHVVPPLSTQRQAETHGVLDVGGRLDPATYAMLVARDGALPEAVHPTTGKGFPVAPAGFALPFLPDPLARTCILTVAGRTGVGSTESVRIPWYTGDHAWPDARPFRLEVLELLDGGALAPIEVDETAGVVRVPLAKADRVRVRIAHELRDDDLALLGLWRWAQSFLPADPVAAARLVELAHEGQHWMLTPWIDVELVHAVQRPLVVPALEALSIVRATGDTVASLAFQTPVDSRSTEKLDLVGRWLEPVDDPAEPEPRARVGGGQRAAELKLERLAAPGVNPPGRREWGRRNPVKHEFGDTRYRRVGYRLTAATRFTSFLPEPLRNRARSEELTVTSDETVGFVPNSAPPPAPDVVYVIPTFGWSRSGEDGHARSWRDGGGLRVYLRRPWQVSGYLEMLAVVLPREREPSGEPAMSRVVTQWGADPTWRAGAVQGAAPRADRFALAVTAGPIAQELLDDTVPLPEGDIPEGPLQVTGLPLPGVLGTPLVDVAPHLVHFDPSRKLWYADIVIDPGEAYGPFVKLALARYEPISAFGSHLSPAVTTEVVQLLPDRLAVLTRVDPGTLRVALYGHAPRQRLRTAAAVEFSVERLVDGATDLQWEALPDVTVEPVPDGLGELGRHTPDESLREEADGLFKLRRFRDLVRRPDLIELLRPPLLRQALVRLPHERPPEERWRLVVTEAETRSVDREHLDPEPVPARDPRRRVVYLETIEL